MQQRKLLILSIVSSVLVILYEFFRWRIIDIVTEFMIFPIWLVVFGFFIVILVRINAIENDKYDPTLLLAFKLSESLNTLVDNLFVFNKD